LWRFQEEVTPAQKVAHHQLPEGEGRWETVIPIIEELKVKAKGLGLWNLFLSKKQYPKHGAPLTNLEVRILCLSVSVWCRVTILGYLVRRHG
jgi:acyl-CoA dehydrogenase